MGKPRQRNYFENDNNATSNVYSVLSIFVLFSSMRFVKISSIIRTILHLPVQPV